MSEVKQTFKIDETVLVFESKEQLDEFVAGFKEIQAKFCITDPTPTGEDDDKKPFDPSGGGSFKNPTETDVEQG